MELYIHIPFCKSKCRYCDFASYAGQEQKMSAYVDALLEEAAVRAAQLQYPQMDTVFIGGGTPSLLPAHLLDRLLSRLKELFPLSPGAEFTSEANPGTLTCEWLTAAVHHGVNRLSLGMQAYQPELLRTLGRIHTFDEVKESVALCREHGVKNISLDLMFGLPGQTEAQWLETLRMALTLEPEHLSCYGLIPEEGTPLTADLKSGRLSLPDEEAERRMYDAALALLHSHGYEQYEISNFALPGYECRHNLGYWRQIPYLGLGASASSMLRNTPEVFCLRETNPPSLEEYLRMCRNQAWTCRETVAVSPEEARFETLMLGLRTTQGVSEAAYAALHRRSLHEDYGDRLYPLMQQGFLQHQDGWWSLTRKGMDVQNAVLVELMDD